MKQRCILLFVNPYRIVDEKTGDILAGLSVTYLGTSDLSPAVDGNRKGIPTLKQTFSLDLEKQLQAVPGIYDVEFGLRPVAGKPTVVPVGLEFVSQVDLKDVK